MKFIKWFLGSLIGLILLVIIALKLTGNGFLIKGVWIVYLHGDTSATIDDARFFDTREIEASTTEQKWKESENFNTTSLSPRLRETLESTNSIGFLVVKQGQIEFEEYWKNYGENSHSNSFSMAKSVVSMLTQIAIQKGILNSWNDRVIDYLPELRGRYKEKLQLKHLSTMTAGLEWNEHYKNPFDITARAYYGADIRTLMYEHVPVVNEPGSAYEYQSGATQYLGMVLCQVTGKSLSELTSAWLWKPIGAKYDAYWSLDDEDGMEMAYCCFNSNVRDFARFGKLLIQQGNWNGEQLIESAFIEVATDTYPTDFYGYSFWLDKGSHGTEVFYMRGILGQYVIVIPEKELVIVRLGEQRMGKSVDVHPDDFHIIVDEVLKGFG
jgi:CubicO group peptidase (beta-lactamase class C family)